jgi:hypothetical protein
LPKAGVAKAALASAGTMVLLDVGWPAAAVSTLLGGVPYRTPFTDQYMVALGPMPPATNA